MSLPTTLPSSRVTHSDDKDDESRRKDEQDFSGVQDEEDSAQTIGLFGGHDWQDEGYHISRASKISRMLEILRIASRYDVWHGLTPLALRQLLEELGPTFVKAGQILSMRSEILPESFCRELKKLRTQVEPMDRTTMLEALRAEYSTPIEDIFDAIDDVPLGSASIAQVHKARLVSGELVAIKIQRPHVREIMAQDISIMRSVAKRAGRMISGERFIDLSSVVDELWQSFREETDFLVEARSLEEFRHNNVNCAYVDCPKPYRRWCTRHVVVMDYIEGISIDDTAELKRQGYDLEEIGIKLVDNYTQQLLDDGFFHADPHPGNLKIRDGKIVYLDLGLMGHLSAHDRSALQDMVIAVGERNSEKLKDGLLRFSISDASEVDNAGLLANLDQIIADYGEADLGELNIGDFFNALVGMARKCGVVLPGTVTMLARSLVTLEGVVDEFVPGASIIDIIRHHVLSTTSPEDMVKHEAKEYLRELRSASHGLLQAVSELSGATKMLTRGQLRMQMEIPGTEEPLRDAARAADRLTMGIVIAGLFIGSSVVYYARIQPVIFGIPVIGFLGYLVALGLGLWIVGSIMREGRHHRNKRR
jgi:ubiquinone biosynthesis protein